MRIGFDAKRAFSNNTGLGNYSRDSIKVLSHYFPNDKYFLYTPKKNKNTRLAFINDRENIVIHTPESLLNRTLKTYWRSKSVVKDLLTNKIDIYHGLSNELPIGIENPALGLSIKLLGIFLLSKSLKIILPELFLILSSIGRDQARSINLEFKIMLDPIMIDL